MSEAKECTDFQFKHETLKEILEELGKLHNTESTKKNVFNHLKGDLGTYCAETYLNAFYGDRGYSSYGGYIQAFTFDARNICLAIVERSSWDGRSINIHAEHQDCIQKYSEALKACLPKTFPALFFLFFNVSNECSGIGGGKWNSLPVNGSGKDLYNWLIGESSDDFIARKFSEEELHTSNNGQKVAEKLKSAVSLRPGSTEGSLQRVLCGFMFVCKWDVSLLGHAICFLDKFCSKVSGDSGDLLKGQYKEHSEAFKDVCRGLQSSLEPFINGSSGLSAVCHGNQNLFDTLWDDGKFSDYCTWLKENLHSVINSLKAMSYEPPGWSTSTIPHGFSAGPFKYGFVFTNSSWQDGNINSKLSPFISKLTGEDPGSLGNFKSFLFNPSTPSSAGATAGGVTTGVLGAGGLGFGAAYATNAFGFQNFITSFISSFLK
ncbi:secreted antigen 1 [Babesia divergens]|uniref:Secreted antigen 1 n=1 Tax=Babesia divergens TaxID=32595 RepID=A0AAD9GH30_BABDI|nr:secreted antigen 1 [Babesia divergens]